MQFDCFFLPTSSLRIGTSPKQDYIYLFRCGATRIFFYIDNMDIEQIRRIITEIAEREGVHILDMTITALGREKKIEIICDSESGISANELGRLSILFSKNIEKSEQDFASYTFIVSSPGLERSLLYDWQYRRHAGRRVTLTLRDHPNLEKLYGRIVACNDGILHIDVDGKPQEILLEKVQEAKIEVSFK